MAHVVLGHTDVSPSELGRARDADFSVLRVSQQQELVADQFGLGLQVGSVRHPGELVTALAGSIYFVHITGLLKKRLMLVNQLVDYKNWKIFAQPSTPFSSRVKADGRSTGPW